MLFHVNPSGGLPIYRQIMRQVVDGIAAGRLSPGTQLPSHRELAQTLVVAPLTIKKAYDELERQGYVQMRRGHGSFIAEGKQESPKQRFARLRPSIHELLNDAALLNVSVQELTALLQEEASKRASAASSTASPRSTRKKGKDQ